MTDTTDRLPDHPPLPPRLPQKERRRLMLMTPQMVAIGGLLAFFAVVFSVVVLPTATYEPPVSRNWLPLNDAAVAGRATYLANGCMYCHSGYSRAQDTFAASSSLYSRTSEPGDFRGISQSPNILGTVRTGPDLSNQGGMHPDGWHLAHYWNPRSTTPMSIMQRFNFLTEEEVQNLIAYNQSQGGKAARLRYAAVRIGNYLMRLNVGMAGLDDPSSPVLDLVAELRRTGELRENGKPDDLSPTGLKWEGVWHVNSFARSYWLTDNPLDVTQQNLMRGKSTYMQRCVGCHGVNGDGKGPAAELLAVKPFDFTKKELATDAGTSSGMMYHRILTAGPGTSMENFSTRLSVADIWRVVMFLRTIPNGGLRETLPTVDMYEAWTPPDGLLRYMEDNSVAASYADERPVDDPFLNAARWIAPGMTMSDTVYVGGKLPITLRRLADAIRADYAKMVEEAYAQANGRGEALPARTVITSTEGLTFYAP